MIALTAENAIRPATMSFGLCNSMRISRPRSAGSSMTATLARLDLVDFELALGTLLHLMDRLGRRAAWRNVQWRDVARHSMRWRVIQRKRDGDGGPLAYPALDPHLAAMHADQALDDR